MIEREREGGDGGKRFLISKEAERAIEEGVVRTKGRCCHHLPTRGRTKIVSVRFEPKLEPKLLSV